MSPIILYSHLEQFHQKAKKSLSKTKRWYKISKLIGKKIKISWFSKILNRQKNSSIGSSIQTLTKCISRKKFHKTKQEFKHLCRAKFQQFQRVSLRRNLTILLYRSKVQSLRKEIQINQLKVNLVS